MGKDRMPTLQGGVYTFGVIAVHKVEGGWMAMLHGDSTLWGAGDNLDEAIGDLWRTHHEDLAAAIVLARDFNESGQTPGEMLRNWKSSQQKAEAPAKALPRKTYSSVSAVGVQALGLSAEIRVFWDNPASDVSHILSLIWSASTLNGHHPLKVQVDEFGGLGLLSADPTLMQALAAIGEDGITPQACAALLEQLGYEEVDKDDEAEEAQG